MHLYGDMELNRSQGNPEDRHTTKYTAIKDINASLAGQVIRVRARLHSSKGQKHHCFINMRESFETIQCVVFLADTSPGMMQYAKSIPPESIVEIVAKVVQPDGEIKSCTVQMELHIQEIRCVNKSAPVLPFQLADAMRRVENQALEDAGGAQEESKGEAK